MEAYENSDYRMIYLTDSNNNVSICSINIKKNKISLEIPSEILGHEVVKIESNALKDPEKVINLVFPATIIRIERNAFSKTVKLKSITFKQKSKLEYIGERAFWGVISLESITIPKSVRYIGVEAFENAINP